MIKINFLLVISMLHETVMRSQELRGWWYKMDLIVDNWYSDNLFSLRRKRIKTTNEKLNGQLTNQQSWQRIQDLRAALYHVLQKWDRKCEEMALVYDYVREVNFTTKPRLRGHSFYLFFSWGFLYVSVCLCIISKQGLVVKFACVT